MQAVYFKRSETESDGDIAYHHDDEGLFLPEIKKILYRKQAGMLNPAGEFTVTDNPRWIEELEGLSRGERPERARYSCHKLVQLDISDVQLALALTTQIARSREELKTVASKMLEARV